MVHHLHCPPEVSRLALDSRELFPVGAKPLFHHRIAHPLVASVFPD